VAHRRVGFAIAAFTAALCALSGCKGDQHGPHGEARSQPSFNTPEEAVGELVAASKEQDSQRLQNLLGPGTESLISSGDTVADRKERDSFLSRYDVYHQLVAGGTNDLVLLVGEDRWPLPIPLIQKASRWTFDAPAGLQELLMRRIGANELRTISVLQGYVAAQMDYAASAHDGVASGVYAQKLRSEPGKQDGLYWEVAAGEPQSPAGPFLAAATTEGYAATKGSQAPYHGYLFRPLTSQGQAANGGARSYLRDGRLTDGFALLAYPAKYAASGIMTFMVNQDGVVWQRDFGSDTDQAAAQIQQFDPDDSWTPIAPEG
jgi:Protein of unknown function (DUF2950)